MNLPLNKQVAEKLGWTQLEERVAHGTGTIQLVGVRPGELPAKHTGYLPKHTIPDFSGDIKAAWELVEKLNRDGLSFSASGTVDDWETEFNCLDGRFLQDTDTLFMGRGSTAPEAICLGFLETQKPPL